MSLSESGNRPKPARRPSLEERARLALRAREQSQKAQEARSIFRREGPPDLAPTSFTQQRMWFMDQLQPENALVNIHLSVLLAGVLDVSALERAFGEIVRRHEVLRTTFSERDGRPVQVISPPGTFRVALHDFSTLPEAERLAAAQRLTAAEAAHAFDLCAGPLIRAALLRLGEEEHVLLVTMAHIISDGWSRGVLMNEFKALYEAYRAGRESPLAELSIQYADYAAWQRQRLDGRVLEEQLDYWKRQMAGAPATLELPADGLAGSPRSHRGGALGVTLDADLSAALRSLAKAEGVTLFMLLLAAFKVLLMRYSGQEDIIVGAPVAGRTRAEIEPLVGCFINNLMLRTDLSGDPTFRELLARVREVALGAYAHQDVPFERIIEELQPERSLDRPPFFDILFNNINVPLDAMTLPGLTLKEWGRETPECKYAMVIYVEEVRGVIRLRPLYQADLFSAERAASIFDQFRCLLEQAVSRPGDKLQSYTLVTSSSRLLLPDPSEPLPAPAHPSVPEVFAGLAAGEPSRPALRQGGRVMTYGELYESAAALAQSLRDAGHARGDVVAVLGPRSFGLISGMMGVLMGGGVLLTLDPNLPALRQQVMLREAGVRRLILVGTRPPADAWLEDFPGLETLEVADDGHVGSRPVPPPSAADYGVGADDPAYIFFTSGTTGVPKGVLGRHKGLSHFLAWQRETFGVGPHDRCAQLTNLSFDVVLRDIFLPLTSGATLCLPDEPLDLTAESVLGWMERERISVLHAVPSLTQSWLAQAAGGVSLRHLRLTFSAGEPLTDTLVRRWRESFPEAGKIINLYGPTETTLAKCWHRVPESPRPGVQPVGRPLPQTQALVLSPEGRLCGIAERGEIAIRTPFRTLGYMNGDAEQRSRFAVNPFRRDEADLIYYTGDLGRYGTDGTLEILGRRDNQLKVRGVRVEPGEIEGALRSLAGVRQVVVDARELQPGPKSLVAYVVADAEGCPSASQMRRHLRARLPESMIPTAFVLLDTLPLTPNGKIDRRALPAPGAAAAETEAAYVAPRTPLEELLCGLWGEVLGVERVGVRDNFFELGGHSLLATQIVARVKETFRVTPPLRLLFEEPTVEALAANVERALVEETSAEDVAAALEELDGLSDEEVAELLAAQGG